MSENVVQVDNLSRRFGATLALNDVSLTVKPGFVYGLVGANGHGKTTLLKHILGLLRAQQGSVRVFGMDPVRQPVQVLQRVGYLSEERDLPEWMRIAELLNYSAAYYPSWDQEYAEQLLATFQLDGSKKIKELSKGMRAQAGLIAAVSHRPDLLLLDEPSTGLDAIVRKDILNTIIRAVADDGRTAIFSSHLLDEVEMMSDYIFMINAGEVVLEGDLDEIKAQHQLVTHQYPDGRTAVPDASLLLSTERRGNSWLSVCQGSRDEVAFGLKSQGSSITHSRNASLQEIFVAKAGRETSEHLEASPTGADA